MPEAAHRGAALESSTGDRRADCGGIPEVAERKSAMSDNEAIERLRKATTYCAGWDAGDWQKEFHRACEEGVPALLRRVQRLEQAVQSMIDHCSCEGVGYGKC